MITPCIYRTQKAMLFPNYLTLSTPDYVALNGDTVTIRQSESNYGRDSCGVLEAFIKIH
jgi:hypothetical protein